jgi:hypothetical protein
MVKKTPQPIIHIPLLSWYSDPRDFHEAVLKTSLEAAKLPLPKIAKKHQGKIGVGYLPLRGDALDIWMMMLYLSLLLGQWYDSLCIVHCDYNSDYLSYICTEKGLMRSVIADTPLHQIPDTIQYGVTKDVKDIDNQIGIAVSIAQSLSKLKDLFLLQTGTNNPSHSQSKKQAFREIDIMFNYIHNKNNSAILVIGDDKKDENGEFNGWHVFESIAITLGRTIKRIEFESALWHLQLVVA